MDEQELKKLRGKNSTEVQFVLKEFNKKHADLFDFTQLHVNDNWYAIWRGLFSILQDVNLSALHTLCLNSVRILTRDEHSLQTHELTNDLSCLLNLAQLSNCSGLHVMTPPMDLNDTTEESMQIVLESLKCLCNIVYLNAQCRRQCITQNVTDGIVKRLASSTHHSLELELFDLKLLFLLTALESAARNRVQIDSNGVTYLTEWLDEKLQELSSCDFTEKQMDVLAEMLKVLFNITSNNSSSADKSPNMGNEIQGLHLTGVLRDLLLRFGNLVTEKEKLVVMHAINLLTNIPTSCLSELLTPKQLENKMQKIPTLIFEQNNVRVLEILLRYLQCALNEQESTATSYEYILPVLTVLVKCARSKRVMRHYIRSQILPPLRDVTKRPEQGNELRNYLCRFLTLPDAIVRDLSAELLFVCCKENVSRMIKYTGYGNAAGLFAKRGLLDCREIDNTEDYSSDSEDSDTEEYKAMQHGINPVIGCYEPPNKDPLEGMSEEQKEYEAVRLANLIDKLHRTGVMQPCRIDEDGKPQPVDHILQLQEELPQQQLEKKRKM